MRDELADTTGCCGWGAAAAPGRGLVNGRRWRTGKATLGYGPSVGATFSIVRGAGLEADDTTPFVDSSSDGENMCDGLPTKRLMRINK
jgi:hypothetical protein